MTRLRDRHGSACACASLGGHGRGGGGGGGEGEGARRTRAGSRRTCKVCLLDASPPPTHTHSHAHTPRAGNGKLLSIMRVNNDLLCDLAALGKLQQQQGSARGRNPSAVGARMHVPAAHARPPARAPPTPHLCTASPVLLYCSGV